MMGRFKNIDKYGRNVYLPEHIKKIEIDPSNIDSFMEKLQDFSEQDQTWLIKRLLLELEDKQIAFDKYIEARNDFYKKIKKELKKYVFG